MKRTIWFIFLVGATLCRTCLVGATSDQKAETCIRNFKGPFREEFYQWFLGFERS